MRAQTPPAGDTTALDAVLAADTERSALLAEAETATDPDRLAAIHARLTDIAADAAPSRAASILAGLGFDPAMPATARGAPSRTTRTLGALSTASRSSVRLARISAQDVRRNLVMWPGRWLTRVEAVSCRNTRGL